MARPKLLACLAGAVALGASLSSPAADAPRRLTLSGFGTVGMTYHTTDGAEYRRSIDQPRGARGGRLETGIDSVIGLQANLLLGEQSEAVAQVVSRPVADGAWTPRITWAFLRLGTEESWRLRAGRIGLNFHRHADSRLIGYSYLPVRPSPEVLGMVPFDYLDGADVTAHRPLGDGLLAVRGFAGSQSARVSRGGREADIPRSTTLGLLADYTIGDFQVRAVVGAARLEDNGDVQPLIDGLRATGMPGAAAAADRLEHKHRVSRFLSLDFAFDHGPLRLSGTHFWQQAPDDVAYIADTRAGTLLAGWQAGRFTPYFLASRVTTSGVSLATGLPPVPALAALDAGVAMTVQSGQFVQRSAGIGVRHDVAANTALKFQIERVRADASPLVYDVAPYARPTRSLTLLSATVDFVF